jgi:hypothetical protein
MKNKIFFLFMLFAGCYVRSFSQVKNASSLYHFHSIENIGLLLGNKGSAFQFQTINGVKYKSWFGGVGVGLDYYGYRTIPLFAEIRKEILKSANKLFLYADGGTNFYWQRSNDAKQFLINDKFKNGFYGEVGAGYTLTIHRNNSLQFSIGYSYKKLTDQRTYLFFDPGFGLNTSDSEKIRYSLSRFVFKAGISF